MSRPPLTRHPLHCIIPPYMIDALKLRGDDKQRKMATSLEKQSDALYAERDAHLVDIFEEPAAAVPRRGPLAVDRAVYDANRKTALPGAMARKEGDPPSADAAVNQAYDGAGAAYDLFASAFGRDSLDGRGLKIVSTVHYRQRYNNAIWNGTQMAYGDGDGVVFQAFTRSLSVIAHELSHGVIHHSGGLVYRGQSGAINEHVADVFGCLTEQYQRRQAAHEADWLIGKGIFGAGIHGEALRSLKAPGMAYDDKVLGTDPQPYHMSAFVITLSDNGGVHINSAILNHAFYLLAQYLGGNAWEKAGQIWYDALQAIRNPNASFDDWADKTVEVARDRYGAGSFEAVLTRRAWKLVGINA